MLFFLSRHALFLFFSFVTRYYEGESRISNQFKFERWNVWRTIKKERRIIRVRCNKNVNGTEIKVAICKLYDVKNVRKTCLECAKQTPQTRQHSVNVRVRTVVGSHEEKGNGALSIGGASDHSLARDWLDHGRATEAPLALIKHFGTPSRLRLSRVSSPTIRSPTAFIFAVFLGNYSNRATEAFL